MWNKKRVRKEGEVRGKKEEGIKKNNRMLKKWIKKDEEIDLRTNEINEGKDNEENKRKEGKIEGWKKESEGTSNGKRIMKKKRCE